MAAQDPTRTRVQHLIDGHLGPVVAVSVDAPPVDRELDGLWRAGADVVEYRLDRFAAEQRYAGLGTDHDPRLLKLLTIRHGDEGGAWVGSESDRLACYQQLVGHFSMVDIEARADIAADVVAAAHAHAVPAIVSAHNFERPWHQHELDDLVETALGLGGDLLKVACYAKTETALAEVARWLVVPRSLPVLAVLMGPMGPASRCLFPLLGSRLTYAHASGARTAGQLSLPATVATLSQFSPTYCARKQSELSTQAD